ncbi:MAG: hypothetical protein J6W76_02480, partial [Spirochaetales bacterium]|nr:hypothetical protein [Spirochaetales bacterium]
MKKLTYFVIITFILILFGCTTDQAGSQTVTTETTNQPGGGSGGNGGQTPSTTIPNGDSNKITSLQILINSDKVQNGTLKEIDLSQYPDIDDYSATINKAVTITNGNDLKGASLNVVTDGVKLDGIKGASVTTQSSLKISSSSLSSLNIAAVSSPSANMIVGRGDISTQPPVVEVDNTEVADDVSVGIANAYLTVEKFTAKKNISLDAVNVQLTINDKKSNIKEIKTEHVCQVILEDGTSDTIPKPNVSGDGELKQINMKAAGEMKLLALTPMSGLTTVAKQGEAIDFSTAVVLGTYQADDGVTVFKAGGLSYNLTETFSKLEKDFKISIKDKGVVYEKNQNVSTFSWTSLTAGKYTAVIDIDYQYKETSYKSYEFEIVIIGAAEHQTEIVIPTFTLTDIEVQKGSEKIEYAEGEPLNLSGL